MTNKAIKTTNTKTDKEQAITKERKIADKK